MGVAIVTRRQSPRLGTAGPTSVRMDPTLLFLGIGAVAVAAMLFGESPAHLKRKKRRAKKRAKIKELWKEIRSAESEE